MKNVMICKRCGDDLGLKYEGTIELGQTVKEYYWEQVNKIEELNNKLNNCRSIISLCAEKLIDEESGALWAAYDILKNIEDDLDRRIYNLMDVYDTIKITKKAKKK